MQSRSLLLIPVLSAVCLLSACASPVPKADPGEAWIGLRDGTDQTMLAEKVDGKRWADGRFFEVKPGNHDLGVMVYDISENDDTRTCSADIDYKSFKAGQHYKLVESSLGENLSADLVDGHGKTVAHAGHFDCMPG